MSDGNNAVGSRVGRRVRSERVIDRSGNGRGGVARARSNSKIFITNEQSPGDIVMLTAAVRDLKLAHPNIIIGVKTSCDQLWENNPHIDHDMKRGDADIVIKAGYPLIHKSNKLPYHFIHGFRKDLEEKLNLSIPCTAFHGDIHLSDDEKNWKSQVEEAGHKEPFWIVMAGGKFDFTAKWWNPKAYQKVVDGLVKDVTFVQCGEDGHHHPSLENVINLVGKTDLRQYIRLMYHAQGVVCPVTFAMHLAAAVPSKEGYPKNKPCVVIAGGREPAQWEQYPHHRYLSTNGALPCCADGGCWRSRCQTVGDGDDKDKKKALCEFPVRVSEELLIPKCMTMIAPSEVIRAVNMYFHGGIFKKKELPTPKKKQEAIVELGNCVTFDSKLEFSVCGLKRSGNHALLDWIYSQYGDKQFFLNDVKCRKKTVKSGMTNNDLPSNKGSTITAEETLKLGKLDLFMHSHEEHTHLTTPWHDSVNSDKQLKVCILRDVFNWVSSFRMMTIKHPMGGKFKRCLEKYADMWLEMAEIFKEEDTPEGVVCVSYNHLISDQKYRDNLADKLGIDPSRRSDESLSFVPRYGWASSFDGKKFNGSAQEMKVTDRWREFAEEQWFKDFITNHPRHVELSIELFGAPEGIEAVMP